MTARAPGRLCELFCAHAPGGATPSAELEQTLVDLVAAARDAWPGLGLDDALFVRHLAERAPATTPAALRALNVTDLYLACGCAHGRPAALQAFEARALAPVAPAVGHLGPAPFVDEVLQLLRHRLLLSEGGAPPRIAGYLGRGSLAGWTRAAAVRLALNLKRDDRPTASDDDALAHLPAPGASAEVEVLRTQYAAEFAAAFGAALAALTAQERNLLRFHFVDGLTVDQIGPLLHVSRATAGRWVLQAREHLFGGVRQRLTERLKLTAAELHSLFAAVRSHLDVSIHRWLGERER